MFELYFVKCKKEIKMVLVILGISILVGPVVGVSKMVEPSGVGLGFITGAV